MENSHFILPLIDRRRQAMPTLQDLLPLTPNADLRHAGAVFHYQSNCTGTPILVDPLGVAFSCENLAGKDQKIRLTTPITLFHISSFAAAYITLSIPYTNKQP